MDTKNRKTYPLGLFGSIVYYTSCVLYCNMAVLQMVMFLCLFKDNTSYIRGSHQLISSDVIDLMGQLIDLIY